MANPEKKPWKCKLGFHNLYIDSAMFSSAERCGNCTYVTDEYALVRLNKERKAWDENPDATPADIANIMLGIKR